QNNGVVGGIIKKLSGGSAWNAGAYSLEKLIGAGSLDFEVTEANTHRMVGLSSTTGNSSYETIEYTFYLLASGALYIRESGVNRGSFGTYSSGDIFEIERSSDGVVSYIKNGETIYTSTVISSTDNPLLVDVSLYENGSTLNDVKLTNASGVQEAVTWVTDNSVEAHRLGSDLSVAYQDLNA
ncbi:hypothetical protein WH96_20895, partial [Kiloniella spongiae]